MNCGESTQNSRYQTLMHLPVPIRNWDKALIKDEMRPHRKRKVFGNFIDWAGSTPKPILSGIEVRFSPNPKSAVL